MDGSDLRSFTHLLDNFLTLIITKVFRDLYFSIIKSIHSLLRFSSFLNVISFNDNLSTGRNLWKKIIPNCELLIFIISKKELINCVFGKGAIFKSTFLSEIKWWFIIERPFYAKTCDWYFLAVIALRICIFQFKWKSSQRHFKQIDTKINIYKFPILNIGSIFDRFFKYFTVFSFSAWSYMSTLKTSSRNII